ncbi:hypothetical protein D8674_036268 [Pyrus ussuriensis x Pyrus communis]|uniref:Uncharacterized protein n=1 Tax=Pyrus ussuriensis x Pyrus communis TaxID=2448454 RepID=A0A5N5GK41_9ROSA|nr:uncharacterized protein LOC125474201 [Pyrus x bretschneideri]KAB2613952.1 hypothetical protein D8674_036268 [Pyrus ussuriensis x Pyrus communis]
MEKMRESGRINTVLVTAGAAVLMACLKRFMLMVFLMEQWRAWVFLLLNLVLLAIVFTSISSGTSSIGRECENKNNGENNAEGFKSNEGVKRREYRCPSAPQIVERVKVCEDEMCKRSDSGGGESEHERVEDDAEDEEVRKLSKEDLNEKVEAFIVMFRQHLVSDARN